MSSLEFTENRGCQADAAEAYLLRCLCPWRGLLRDLGWHMG